MTDMNKINITTTNGLNAETPEGLVMLHTLQRAPRDGERTQRIKGLTLKLTTKKNGDTEVNTFTVLEPANYFFGLGNAEGTQLSYVRPGADPAFAVIGEFDPSSPIPAEFRKTPKKGQQSNGQRRGRPNRDNGNGERKERAPGYAKAYVADGTPTIRVFSDEGPLSPDTNGSFKLGPASLNVNREVLVADDEGNPLTIVSTVTPASGPVDRIRYKDTDHESIRFVYQRCSNNENFEARIRFGTPDSSAIAPMIRNGAAVLAIGDYLLPVPTPGTYDAGETFELKAGTIVITGIWEKAANGKLEVAHLTSSGPEFSNSRENTRDCRFRFRKQDAGGYRADYRLGAHTPSFGTRWDQSAGVGYVSLFGKEQRVIAGDRKEGETFELTFSSPDGDHTVTGTWHIIGDKYQIAELRTPEGFTFHCRSKQVNVCCVKFQKQEDAAFRCVFEDKEFTRKPKKADKKS